MQPHLTTQRHDAALQGGLGLVAVFRDGAKRLHVVDGAELVVGRSYPADMVVVDSSISRQHARVRVLNGFLEITDLNSTNGTWIGGRRVAQGRVPAGEPVRLGDVTLMLQASPSRIHGIDGYDSFSHWLEQEIVRAETFARPLALMSIAHSINTAQALTVQLPIWDRVSAGMRAVDRMGMYAPWEVLVGLPEITRAAALELGKSMTQGADVRLAVVEFPTDGRTLDQLLGAVRNPPRSPKPPGHAGAAQLGRSVIGAAMQKLTAELTRVASSRLPVLLIGETGVGKELLAKAVHAQSPRSAQPYVAFNCASVPQSLLESVLFGHEKGAFTGAERTTRGVFEQAHGGTLFLDEVGELTPALQAALLRVLETQTLRRVGSERDLTVDVRIVAATHRDLPERVEAGAFRADLLFRLEGALIQVPPLRARKDEIESLAHGFLQAAAAESGRPMRGFAPAARAALLAHAWPGNVRELKNAVARAAVIAQKDLVELADLPARVQAAVAGATPDERPRTAPGAATGFPADLAKGAAAGAAEEDVSYKERIRLQLQRYESELLQAALERHAGNQTAAAAELKMPIRTFAHKMKELGIKR